MDSKPNISALNISSLPEISAIQIPVVSESSDSLEFNDQAIGLIAISKADFKRLVNSRQQLLREKLNVAETTPTTSKDKDAIANYKILSKLLDEKQNLAEQLASQNEEIENLKLEIAKLKSLVVSYDTDYYNLLADYDYVEELHRRTRDLFKHKISEVYKMQSELREIRIRPRAPEGCLNCSLHGHSFKNCNKPYTGRYCQKCAAPDFSTEECPRPHVAETKFDVPEHLRCKGCKRPRNLPDVNCGECRRRTIERETANRDQQMSKIIDQTRNLQVAPETPPAQAKGAIPKIISRPQLQETSTSVSSRLATAFQPSIQKQKSSRRAAAKIEK